MFQHCTWNQVHFLSCIQTLYFGANRKKWLIGMSKWFNGSGVISVTALYDNYAYLKHCYFPFYFCEIGFHPEASWFHPCRLINICNSRSMNCFHTKWFLTASHVIHLLFLTIQPLKSWKRSFSEFHNIRHISLRLHGYSSSYSRVLN